MKTRVRICFIPQCARSLILREKWGVASLIKSMYFQHLGTISSHFRAKFVSLTFLLINYGGYQTENPTVLLLKWQTFKKYHCAALCRDATYIGPLQRSIDVICQNFQPSGGLPNLLFLVLLSGHQSLPHFQQNEPSCTLCNGTKCIQKFHDSTIDGEFFICLGKL